MPALLQPLLVALILVVSAPHVSRASGFSSGPGSLEVNLKNASVFLPAWPYEPTRESFAPSIFVSPTLQLGVNQPLGPLRVGAGIKGQWIGGIWAWVGGRADAVVNHVILDLSARYLVHSIGRPQKWITIGAGSGYDSDSVAIVGGVTVAQRINGVQRPVSVLVGPEIVAKKKWGSISMGGQGRVYSNTAELREAPVISLYSHFAIWLGYHKRTSESAE